MHSYRKTSISIALGWAYAHFKLYYCQQHHVPESQYPIEESEDNHQSEISPDRLPRESQFITEPTMQTQHVVRNENPFYEDIGNPDFDDIPSMDDEPSKNGNYVFNSDHTH